MNHKFFSAALLSLALPFAALAQSGAPEAAGAVPAKAEMKAEKAEAKGSAKPAKASPKKKMVRAQPRKAPHARKAAVSKGAGVEAGGQAKPVTK